MRERDAIAEILRKADPTETLLWRDAETMADALIAAGFRKATGLEQAWDEGFIAGALDSAINEQPAPNPYRREGGAA